LDNDHAITKLLGSDGVIIKETLDSKPNLVSIDSPLSLPVGRVSVSDDDPGRNDYGIMRYCERILKKRGVNVYPSLIPSMQRLTARGIQLANNFRSLGIPVIESYPGAAQDIMNIPRKRASLELLANGLAKFGVKGDFIKNSVKHDELDAITSAIVGFFFWSGKFEGLGNDEEEYLIIPDIKNTQPSWRERRVIGFSGPIAAGKTTASTFLQSNGFHYGRFSMVIAELVQSRGIQLSRQTLQQTGQEINETKGQRWLGKKLIQMLPKRSNLVIDGLRFPEDHAFLVETFGPAFLHIHIDAPEATRLERYISDGGTKEEFVEANCHQVESSVLKLSSLAHVVLDNASDKESFREKIWNTTDIQQNDKGECLLCQ
jgi:predicted nuclease with RNAse H fold/dephospho-CoA kinase